MEQRKITVVSTRDQIRKTFMSSAKTLGELKKEMTVNGVDHEGLTYLEGLTKAEYIDDSSVLPLTVSYEDPSTGEEKITNELVFILSQPNKKIKSGALTRAEIYEYIKKLHLEDEVKKVYGKNYTQVSTDALGKLINECTADSFNAVQHGNGACQKKAATEPETPSCTSKPFSSMFVTVKTIKNLQSQIDSINNNINAIKKAIECICARSGVLDVDDVEAVMETLTISNPTVTAADEYRGDSDLSESSLPKSILDNIINGLN